MTDIESRLREAINRREAGDGETARALLSELLKEDEANPALWYQMAWTHDAMELEAEAVPYYRKALELGLAGEDRRGAMLGLGSTYRALGSYDEARDLFRQAKTEYPDAREFELFDAMALANLGRHGEAIAMLLRQLAETSADDGIRAYRRAIAFYADEFERGDP